MKSEIFETQRIDLMHNDVKQFAARTCIVGVVDRNELSMAWYFPEAVNLNGNNADMCSHMVGPSSSSSGDLFDFRGVLRHYA